jgi:hypothetical protein
VSGFDPQTLRLLENEAEVDIETRRRDGSARRTTIWVVADGDDVFIRSVRGPDGAWYRAVSRDGDARLHVGDKVVPVRATSATDAASVERVSEAIKRKYEKRWPGPTASMLRPETLGTTLLLQPA